MDVLLQSRRQTINQSHANKQGNCRTVVQPGRTGLGHHLCAIGRHVYPPPLCPNPPTFTPSSVPMPVSDPYSQKHSLPSHLAPSCPNSPLLPLHESLSHALTLNETPVSVSLHTPSGQAWFKATPHLYVQASRQRAPRLRAPPLLNSNTPLPGQSAP